MHIIIPMSGMGRRFISAGYNESKPLIEVDGKPIIEHVVNLFQNEKHFSFIVNTTHLKESNLRQVLNDICPGCDIFEIAPHEKGPVYAVSRILDYVDDEEEVIVNYCDFSKYWDYADFLEHTRKRCADGAISAYRGFHPHMLGNTQYAFMRADEQWMLEIREKQPFTNNRMQEYASDGTYYFKNGYLVKKYFSRLIQKDINLNGEYYVSMVYNLLKDDNLKISIYEIQHMLQWGTPEDLKEYQQWSDYFEQIIRRRGKNQLDKDALTLIPMAGRGKRFVTAGFVEPKPLIEVSGKPMVVQAVNYLPSGERKTFICLNEHLEKYPLRKDLSQAFPQAKIIGIDALTEGQACTCEIGLKGEDLGKPLLIGACDNGALWDSDKLQSLINDGDVDSIVWSFRHHPSSVKNPELYGWIKTEQDGTVSGVSVKKPISDNPYEDHAIIGTFYFKKAEYFIKALGKMYEKNIRVNNEFYVDSCVSELIELGLKVKVFQVDKYICWGTPEDLMSFDYWQSFFHKCPGHPYSLEKDLTMALDKVKEYNLRYRDFQQEYR